MIFPLPRRFKKEVGRGEASAFMWIPSCLLIRPVLLVKRALTGRLSASFQPHQQEDPVREPGPGGQAEAPAAAHAVPGPVLAAPPRHLQR